MHNELAYFQGMLSVWAFNPSNGDPCSPIVIMHLSLNPSPAKGAGEAELDQWRDDTPLETIIFHLSGLLCSSSTVRVWMINSNVNDNSLVKFDCPSNSGS